MPNPITFMNNVLLAAYLIYQQLIEALMTEYPSSPPPGF
jgi:hypothetical protein